MLIKNGSTFKVVFFLTDLTDGETPETGLSPTMKVSKNGGNFDAAANSVSEILDTDDSTGTGWYSLNLSASETDTDGPLILRCYTGATKRWEDIHQVYTNLIHDDEMDDIADHILMRNTATTESSGSGDTIQQYALINAIRAIVGRVEISGSSLNVYEEDESTTAFTRTVATDASADPVTGLS